MTDDATLRALLLEDWAALDPELPPLLDLLMAKSAGEDWHKAGTFRDHLLGLHRTLTLWHQPREVRLLGLFHSVYGNEYVNLQLFDRNGGREALRQALGVEAERLVFTFCAMPRTLFTQRVIEAGSIPAEGMTLPLPDGGSLHIGARDAAIFTIVTLADIAEQWHSWQDEVFAGYPWRQDRPVDEAWASALWPGPLWPSCSVLGMLSRLALPLSTAGTDLPLPPIFAHCTAVLAPEDEQAAVALYWQVVTRALPISTRDAAWNALRAAARHNPHVGEPHIAMAQLALAGGEWDAALHHAEEGLRLLVAWGVAWDKRIAWSGWVAWARILVQSAQRRQWPGTIGGLNGLGLVA